MAGQSMPPNATTMPPAWVVGCGAAGGLVWLADGVADAGGLVADGAGAGDCDFVGSGSLVGDVEGDFEGVFVGVAEGVPEGFLVGGFVDVAVGSADGSADEVAPDGLGVPEAFDVSLSFMNAGIMIKAPITMKIAAMIALTGCIPRLP
ncbi:hypothetical protein [Actinocorallia herbida]|uniref:hypothetical protein n=1 Tax=Actinocorallia herbida TaxID=58109 RepID=UPI0011CD997E|nr:hypothetical protein [Actinocorallia herbida]